MADRLHVDGHRCDCMHGNLRQSKRQKTLIAFRSGKIRILISTELAARGLDVPSIQHVINYHLPQVQKILFIELEEQQELGLRVVLLLLSLLMIGKCGMEFKD